MSVFTPFTSYRVHFQALRPGDKIKIQDKFYMIITAREDRPEFNITGAQTKLDLDVSQNQTTTPGSECMAGLLAKNRIVHIQYVSVDTDVPTQLYWGTEPLMSKDVDLALGIDNERAGLTNPLIVDRWSYDTAMRLSVSQPSTQNYYFEIMEYEVTPFLGIPDRPYLQIMANGQAIMVADEATAKTIAGMGAK